MTKVEHPEACRRWTQEERGFVKEWYPHFGTYRVALELNKPRSVVSTYANWLGVRILPKSERLCVKCRKGHQYNKHAGLFCKICFLSERKRASESRVRPLAQWIRESLATIRYRNHGPCGLTVDYMVALWNQQDGCCYYSGERLVPQQRGTGRGPLSPSVDRIDSAKGYEPGNVVWASWICNAGKSDLSVQDYVTLCQKVSLKHTGTE